MELKKFYDALQQADAKVNQVATRINDLFDENKIEEAQTLQPELQKAKAERDAANSLYLSMAAVNADQSNPAMRFVPAGGGQGPKQIKDMRASPEYMRCFFEAMRVGATPKGVLDGQFNAEKYKMLMDVISETGGSPAGSEGGFLNPVEFDNRIRELMREYVDLSDSVNVEEVQNYSGWRVIETLPATSPLSSLTELDVLTNTEEGESPTFTKVDYTIVDRGDFLRVSNDQLNDTPVNIMSYLGRWFAKKVVLTNNYFILIKFNALTPGTPGTITDPAKLLAGIKTALNKTLDPAFSATAKIFTNQTGLDIMDQLDDGVGRPLLQPDPSAPTAFRVKGRPVVILSDAHWANQATSPIVKSRIVIGDGTQFVTLFRRAAFEFASTTIGGDAWRSNSTEVRGIYRMDCERMDASAMCQLLVNQTKA
ncbi:MAG: phage major capsid protein [Anaerolineales bacterium]|jgi:HK97 family phage major capsid protein